MHGDDADATQPLSGAVPPLPPDVALPGLLLLISLSEIVAASIVCGTYGCYGVEAYAVSIGVVSMAATLLVAVGLQGAYHPISSRVPHVSAFLLVWWIVGAFVLTFLGPFTSLCNGYILSWAALWAAFQLCRRQSPWEPLEIAISSATTRLRTPAGHAMLLATASAVVWVEAAVCVSRAEQAGAGGAANGWAQGWAVAVGIVSMVASAGRAIYPELFEPHDAKLSAALAVWWVQGLAITFIPTPFLGSVNGCVGTSPSILLSATLCLTWRRLSRRARAAATWGRSLREGGWSSSRRSSQSSHDENHT